MNRAGSFTKGSRLGVWAAGVAGSDADAQSILAGVPGPMCPVIDAAKSGGRWGLTRPTRVRPMSCAECGDHYTVDDYDALWSEVQDVIEERDRAHVGLEECRTALDIMRGALVDALEMAKHYRDEADRLRPEETS